MIVRSSGFCSKVGYQHGRRSLTFLLDLQDPNNDETDFPSFFPPPGRNGKSSSAGGGPDKSQIYSNDELWDLLQVHQGLSEQMDQRRESVLLPGETTPEAGAPSLHDLVLQAVEDLDGKTTSNKQKNVKETLQTKRDTIIAIASDVDGTLLGSTHTLHPRTETAIRKAVQAVQSTESTTTTSSTLKYFFPATGKTRKGALDSLGPEIRDLLSNLPGVFIQGLYCVDANGTVLFEQKLSKQAIVNAEALGKTEGVTLLAYDGDNLYSNPEGDPALVAEIHEKWGEPRPSVLSSLSDHSNGFHKILLVHQKAEMLSSQVRPKLESLAANYEATVTQAIPTMLELLPQGCSKAVGVEKLCQALGIDPRQQLLAIGDAENDVGMLELAAIGIAVKNACPMAKEAADYVMEESSDEGGAGAAMEAFSPLGSDDDSRL